METFSALLAICAGNSPVPGEFPAQRSVTRSFDVFFDLRLNKRLSKQSWGWWFEKLSCPLWRHRNAHQTWDRWKNPLTEDTMVVKFICVKTYLVTGWLQYPYAYSHKIKIKMHIHCSEHIVTVWHRHAFFITGILWSLLRKGQQCERTLLCVFNLNELSFCRWLETPRPSCGVTAMAHRFHRFWKLKNQKFTFGRLCW